MVFKSLFISLMHKVDLYLALLILLLSSSLTLINHLFMKQVIISEFAIAVVCTSALYLLVYKKYKVGSNTINLNLSPAIMKALNLLFFLLVILINYTFHSYLYRPPIYYIFIVLCCALIVLDILYGKNQHYFFWTLFKIFIIALMLRANLLYEYPGFYGVDPWTHIFWVQLWQEVGHVASGPGGLIQSNYPPLFHIEILMSLLVTDLNLKDSFFVSVGVMYCVVVFFIFLYVKNIIGVQIGLLSSLFIAVNQFHISWGAWLIPTSLGVLVFSIFLYLIHSRMNKNRCAILFILVASMLIYLHTLSPLVISIAIFVYLISNYLFARIGYFNSSPKINYKITAFLVATLGILTFSQFMYRQYTAGGRTFLESVLYPLSDTLSTDAGFAGGEIASYTASNFPLNRVSFLLIIAFTIFGGLFWFKRESGSLERISLIFTAIALMIFSYGPALLNVDNFIPGRWLVFLMIVLAPICVFGMYQMSLIPNARRYQIFLLLLIIMICTFFSINSNGVNLRTPFYGELSEDPARYAYTHSELQAANTITTISVSPIVASRHYLSQPFQYYQMDKFGAEYALDPQKYAENDGLLKVTRAYDISHNMDTSEIVSSIQERERDDLVYNCRFVWATFVA